MPVHCPLSNNGSTWLFSFSPNHLWILRDLCFLFWSPSSLSSSPHLKPQQSHSLLTCMTTGIVHSTSLWPALQNSQSLFFPTSRRKKTTRKHTNTNIAIFFFLQWPGNIQHFITAVRQQNLSFQLPKSCPLPSQKSLSQTTAQSQTNDFSIPILLSPTHALIFHPALRVPLGISHPFARESIKFQGHIHTGCLNTEGCSLYSLDPKFSIWCAMERERLFQAPIWPPHSLPLITKDWQEQLPS